MSDSVTLYLVRHAVAADAGPEYPDDTERPLTRDGTDKFRKEVRALLALDASIDLICSSPLVRAMQTAQLLSETFTNKPPVIPVDGLAPGGTFNDLMNAVASLDPAGEIAFVGHEPGIGSLASRLIGGSCAIVFKKGAVCRIDVDKLPPRSPGELRWFLTPKIMKLLSG